MITEGSVRYIFKLMGINTLKLKHAVRMNVHRYNIHCPESTYIEVRNCDH